MVTKPTIGLGILSWKAHETLEASLRSYPAEFLSFFDKHLIYFSDINDQDIAIANQYGWNYAGGPNEGIAGGMKRLSENLDTDYVLLLQNDNPLYESSDFAIKHIQQAVQLLEDGYADMARMRHRWKVGEGFADVTKYLRYYPLHQLDSRFIASDHDVKKLIYPDQWKKQFSRFLKPFRAHRFKGRSVFIEQNPDRLYPDYIQKIDDFYLIDSAVIDFTDQCLLISRQNWLDIFIPFVESHPSCRCPNGFQAPEICINRGWWRNNHFKILQGQGVFTHARYDGSFRAEHHTNQKTKTGT